MAKEILHNLRARIFQLVYHGHFSDEACWNKPIRELNEDYSLLVDQKRKEEQAMKRRK